VVKGHSVMGWSGQPVPTGSRSGRVGSGDSTALNDRELSGGQRAAAAAAVN